MPVGVLALLDFTAQHVPLGRLKLACPWGLPVSLYLGKRIALEGYPLTIVALHSQVRLWLQADIQSPEIEVRFTPSSRRSGQGRECLKLLRVVGHLP